MVSKFTVPKNAPETKPQQQLPGRFKDPLPTANNQPQQNAPRGKSVTTAIGETANIAGQRSEQMFNKNVPLYNVQPIQAQQVQAARVGVPMGTGDMKSAIDAAQGNVAMAGQVDPQVAAYLQAAQQGGANTAQSLDLLRAAAMGQGPSAAQAQMQAGVDQAIKAQMAAAGARGFNAAAMRGAQMQGAEMQQAAVNQAAMLRAQEMQAAQQAFAQGALTQEEMARQAAIQAGQTTLQQRIAADEAKQAAINAYLSGSGQMLQTGAQLTGLQAQMQQEAALANAENALRAGMFTGEIGLQARQLQQTGQLGYAGLGSDLLSAQLGGYGTLYGGQLQSQSERSAMNRAIVGGLLGAGGAMGAAALMPAASDKNMKKDIKPNKETESFLAALTDNEYKYKDDTMPGTAPGTHYGPMAQDLAKTKMGSTAVINTPHGMMVDPSRGFLLALSGLANINQRLAKLEGK